MNDDQFEYAGNIYKIGKMDTFDQFHVARRLAPALFALGGVAASMKDFFAAKPQDPTNGEEEVVEGDVPKMSGEEESSIMEAFGPVAQAIANMPDADIEYILNKCLSAVYRLDNKAWQKVSVISQGRARLMFKDIDLPVMLHLATKVIQDNLGNFFNALPGSRV